MVGRGSFTESFPLFGQDLSDYDELFSENLDWLLKVRAQERITWSGRHRSPIDDRAVYPRPFQDPMPVWIAVGGTPQSVKRAATLDLPMALAIIGGAPARFRHVVDLYRETAEQAGHDPATLPISINAHGFLADDARNAAEIAFPPFAETMTRIERERGWPPTSRAQFDAETTLRGAAFVGSPQEVIEKILYQHEIFQHQRFLLQLTVGPMPHAEVMRAIELLGTEIVPVVKREIGTDDSPGAVSAIRFFLHDTKPVTTLGITVHRQDHENRVEGEAVCYTFPGPQ